MKNKIIGSFIGMVIIVVTFLLVGSALAGPKQCPPGQRGNCSEYIQKQTGMIGCFPDQANLGNGWIFSHKGCSDNEPDPYPDPTELIKLFNTPEPRPTFFPPPTIEPGSTVTVIATKWTSSNHTSTPTALLVDSGKCPDNCLCTIAEQLTIANDLQRTEIAIQLNQNGCPIP